SARCRGGGAACLRRACSSLCRSRGRGHRPPSFCGASAGLTAPGGSDPGRPLRSRRLQPVRPAETKRISRMETVLTGITTTGAPHIGNYVGAIRPAIAASENPNTRSFLFLADYHSLVKGRDPERVAPSTLEIAAAWLACGLNPDKVVFYRQSDIPEILELNWILTCLTAKGLMNRAHAYKAAVAENEASGDRDPDKGVTMGLFCYPILMAADILMFKTNKV